VAVWCQVVGFVIALPAVALEPFEIPATGDLYEVSFGSEDSPSATLEVYFISPGNVSLAVGLVVEGPPGTQAIIDSMYLPTGVSSYASALQSAVAVEPSTLKGVTDTNGRETDRCSLDPAGAGGRVQLLYHLHKDACLPDRSSRYISRITFALNQVPASYFTQGFTLRVAVKEYRYPGSEAASIKPVAEGKYRGEPILLMGTIQYGGEYVNIVRRTGQRLRSRMKLPVVKYVYHRGHLLSLARLRGLLNGGKATFELSNGAYIYGVCFSRSRRRQTVNGYPL
jgi:hypothetical protein